MILLSKIRGLTVQYIIIIMIITIIVIIMINIYNGGTQITTLFYNKILKRFTIIIQYDTCYKHEKEIKLIFKYNF